MWAILKIFIEFVAALFLLFMFWIFFFLPRGMWDLSCLTRDRTHNPCVGRWSLRHWTAREVSPKVDFIKWGKQGISRPSLVHSALHGPFKDSRCWGWEAPLVSGLFTGVHAHGRPLKDGTSVIPGLCSRNAPFLVPFRVRHQSASGWRRSSLTC